MPAARYTDWTHVHVIGDREIAAEYLPFARKVLGFVTQQAAFANLGTYKHKVTLKDGTVVVGELIGGIPRITIAPAPRGGTKPPLDSLEDFVVWHRTPGLPDGVDVNHPQLILKPEWTTYWFDADIAGYGSSGNAIGTYGGRFPEGVKRAGNVDWVGKDGDRLSWYGPGRRYWLDRWHQPSKQYARWVFSLGRALLDIDEYCTAAAVDFDERYVVGACRNGHFLYVMQAFIDDAVGPPFLPAPPDYQPLGSGYLSKSYPGGDVSLRLVRYLLVEDAARTDPGRFSVVVGSHETLWSLPPLPYTLVNPWFANPDGTRFDTIGFPLEMHGDAFYETEDEDSVVFHNPDEFHQHVFVDMAVEPVVATASNHSLATPGFSGSSECLVAVDWDKDGNRLDLMFGYDKIRATAGGYFGWVQTWYDSNFYFRLGDYRREHVELERPFPGPFPDFYQIKRSAGLRGLDLRNAAFLWETMEDIGITDPAIEKRYRTSTDLDFQGKSIQIVEPFLQPFMARDIYYEEFSGLLWRTGQASVSPFFYIDGGVTEGYAEDAESPDRPNVRYAQATQPWVVSPSSRPIPYGSPDVYGSIGWTDPDHPDNIIVLTTFDVGSMHFSEERYDTDGMTREQAFVASKDHAAASFAMITDGPDAGTPERKAFNYITKGQLASLTGLGGTDATYNPFWILGKLPKLDQ